jgi:hypothetical protein
MVGSWLKAGKGGAAQLGPVFSAEYTNGTCAKEPQPIKFSSRAAIVAFDFMMSERKGGIVRQRA